MQRVGPSPPGVASPYHVGSSISSFVLRYALVNAMSSKPKPRNFVHGEGAVRPYAFWARVFGLHVTFPTFSSRNVFYVVNSQSRTLFLWIVTKKGTTLAKGIYGIDHVELYHAEDKLSETFFVWASSRPNFRGVINPQIALSWTPLPTPP